jgi:DNA primase
MKDGIPPSVQGVFGIRFSHRYNRILIPIWQKNKLVGIFGRYNEKEISSEYIAKYLPTLAYQKGKVLFPFDINGDEVRKSKSVFLVESEKTPMLCYKIGIRNVLALGGNAIKSHQIELLKELGVESVCIALDKGLEDGYVQLVALRLKDEGFRVSYIDVENIDYLQNKDCIFDLNNKDLINETIVKFRVGV